MYTCVPTTLVYIHTQTGTYNTHNFTYKEQQVHLGKGILGMIRILSFVSLTLHPRPLVSGAILRDKRNNWGRTFQAEGRQDFKVEVFLTLWGYSQSMRGGERDRVGMKDKERGGIGGWGVDPLSSLSHIGYGISRMGSHRGPRLGNDRLWHVLSGTGLSLAKQKQGKQLEGCYKTQAR